MDLNNNPQQVVYSSDYSNQPNQLKNKAIKIVVTLFILLILILIVNYFLNYKNKPGFVASNFVSSVVNNDAAKSYSLASVGFKDSTSANQWQNSVSSVSSVCSNKIKLQDVSTTKTSYKYTYLTEGSESCNISVNIVNDAGKWRVAFFNLNSYN